jgi:hypothetical protein
VLVALTDKEIQSLKPRDKKYKVFDGDGLYLLVHPKGWKYCKRPVLAA